MSYTTLASDEAVQRTVEALRGRGVNVLVVEGAQQALSQLLELLPPGAEVMGAGSTTLEQIGFIKYLVEHPERLRNLRGKILAVKDPAEQRELRRKATIADYYVGSVHGIAETGEVVVASATGSQLGATSTGRGTSSGCLRAICTSALPVLGGAYCLAH